MPHFVSLPFLWNAPIVWPSPPVHRESRPIESLGTKATISRLARSFESSSPPPARRRAQDDLREIGEHAAATAAALAIKGGGLSRACCERALVTREPRLFLDFAWTWMPHIFTEVHTPGAHPSAHE